MRSPAALQPEEAGGVSVSVVIPSFARMHNLPRLIAALLQLPALRRPSSEVIIAHGSRASLAAVPDFEGQALALARGNVTAEVMRDRLAHFDLVALNDEMYVAERFVAGARARNDVRRPCATRRRARPPRLPAAPRPRSARLNQPPNTTPSASPGRHTPRRRPAALRYTHRCPRHSRRTRATPRAARRPRQRAGISPQCRAKRRTLVIHRAAPRRAGYFRAEPPSVRSERLPRPGEFVNTPSARG